MLTFERLQWDYYIPFVVKHWEKFASVCGWRLKNMWISFIEKKGYYTYFISMGRILHLVIGVKRAYNYLQVV